MLCSWASHIRLLQLNSRAQGYSISLFAESAGTPFHSLIPFGVEYTSQNDLAIDSWIRQTSSKIRKNIELKYLEGREITRHQQEYILKQGAKWLFGG